MLGLPLAIEAAPGETNSPHARPTSLASKTRLGTLVSPPCVRAALRSCVESPETHPGRYPAHPFSATLGRARPPLPDSSSRSENLMQIVLAALLACLMLTTTAAQEEAPRQDDAHRHPVRASARRRWPRPSRPIATPPAANSTTRPSRPSVLILVNRPDLVRVRLELARARSSSGAGTGWPGGISRPCWPVGCRRPWPPTSTASWRSCRPASA